MSSATMDDAVLDPDVTITIHMPAFHGGGAENALVRMANYWRHEGRKARFVVNDAVGPVRARLDEGIEVVSLGALATRQAFPRLVGWLSEHCPPLFVTALPSANVAGAAAIALARRPVTTVALVRNHTTTELRNDSWKARRIMAPALKWAFRKADGVGCVSTSVAEDAVDFAGLDPSRVFTTYNAVPGATSAAAPSSPRAEPLILSVGRLEPQKDFASLIGAFARLVETHPARLRILGEGAQRDSLTQLAATLGVANWIEFAGYAPDVDAHMAQADLFVLPSLFEGFPNVLVEAMALGRTVVATDAPGGSSEILGGGQFGYLAGVGDPDSIAAALRRALDRPLPPDLVRRSTDRFTMQAVARRYERGFAQAMTRRTPE